MHTLFPLASADWLALFGRFHPVLLHLPIGLLAGLLAMEGFVWWRGRGKNGACPDGARQMIGLVAVLLAPLAVLTAAAGWVLSLEHRPASLIIQVHQWLGIAVAAGAVAIALAHGAFMRKPSAGRLAVFRAALVGTVLLAAPAGHLGGLISHGEHFLSRHAPAWLAPALGPPPGLASPEPAAGGTPVQAPINARCPMTDDPVKDGFRRVWRGSTIGFCCGDCPHDWDALSDARRDELLGRLLPQAAPKKEAAPAP